MTGKRCDYGRFCEPNPCRNGGVCEEGDEVPLCMCRGYMGPTCEFDVNECDNMPCGHGATCVNEPGSFRCECPSHLTGSSCGDPLYSNSITSSISNMTYEQMIGVGGGIILIVILIIICAICCCVCRKKKRKSSKHHNNINNDPRKDILNDHQQYKRVSKMSNLEVMQCQQRPASYTATANEHPYTTCNTVLQYNNLDTLRSYGSAGDELENVPPEYRKLNRPNQQAVNINSTGTSSDTESMCKQKWCDQIQMQTFSDNKPINNDFKRQSPLSHQQLTVQMKPTAGILPGRLMVASPHLVPPGFEDPPGCNAAAYHWDCSDWVGRSHNPLPNITEVPGQEVPDSSSFHSNESNESHPKNHMHTMMPPMMGPVDPARDIETLNEDIESEFVDDSECDQPLSINFDNMNHSIPCLNPLDSGSDDYRFNTGNCYGHFV